MRIPGILGLGLGALCCLIVVTGVVALVVFLVRRSRGSSES